MFPDIENLAHLPLPNSILVYYCITLLGSSHSPASVKFKTRNKLFKDPSRLPNNKPQSPHYWLTLSLLDSRLQVHS